MLITDIDVKTLAKLYQDTNLQEGVVQWIGCLRAFDKTGKESWLEIATDTALVVIDTLPFDTVIIEDEESTSPSEIMAVIGYDMVQMGLIPEYHDKGLVDNDEA